LTSTLALVAMNGRAARLHDDRFAAAGLTAARAATALAAPVMVPTMKEVIHISLCGSGQTERGDHGATDSHPFHDAESPSLGIRIRGPSPSVGDVPAKCFFVGSRALDLVRKSRLARRRASRYPELPTAVAPLETTKRFSTTQRSPSCGPCWARVPDPSPHFQAVHEARPSRSVAEGLDQSIGGIRMTALVAQTSNSQGGYVKPRAGFFGVSACEIWMRP
jgi:hypothetical protein